jgi:GNAT superfamily N-acetyltransferase
MLSDDRPPTINAEKMLPVLTYRLRPATDEDVGFLADVVIEATQAQGRLPNDIDERNWRNGFAEWTREQVRGEIPDSTTSVVEVDNERVGRLRIVRTAECIELSGIQLLPGIQRHGIGTAIIEDLKAQAAAAGIPLDLGVEKDNPDARKLYERLGFAQVDETEQEYRLRWNPRLDTDLPPSPTYK